MDLYISVLWMRMSLNGQLVEDSTFGDSELKKTGGCFACKSGKTAMGYGENASKFDMPKLWNRL